MRKKAAENKENLEKGKNMWKWEEGRGKGMAG